VDGTEWATEGPGPCCVRIIGYAKFFQRSTVAAPVPGEDPLSSSEPLDNLKGVGASELEGRKGKEGKTQG
jgi:hypothetical protein